MPSTRFPDADATAAATPDSGIAVDSAPYAVKTPIAAPETGTATESAPEALAVAAALPAKATDDAAEILAMPVDASPVDESPVLTRASPQSSRRQPLRHA